MKKLTLILTVFVLSLLVLVGCSQEFETLEEYYAEYPEQLQELKAKSETEQTEIIIEDNTIIHRATSEEMLSDEDIELTINNMTEQDETLSTYYGNLIDTFAASTQIEGITVRAELANSTGEVFYSKTYE